MSNSKPRVILSAANISHYHYTALALQNAGYLYKYFCVFSGQDDLKLLLPFLPMAYRKKLNSKTIAGIDSDRVYTFPVPYFLVQALAKIHVLPLSRQNAWFSEWYDLSTCNEVHGADVFHFVSSIGLRSATVAKQQKMILVCDVRAAHVDAEDEILRHEYRQLGLSYRSTKSNYRERIISEYQIADAFIVPSQYVARSMIDFGVLPEDIHVVPYGVDIQRFGGSGHIGLARCHDKESIFRALFVGNVIPQKGLHYLIRAWESLRLPNSELLVIGHCPDTQYLKLVESMVKTTQVRFVRHLPQIDLYRYYRQADVFILPSLSEGSALVVYEAMSAALPILTTTSSGSVVRNGIEGFVISPANTEALKDRLLWFFEHPSERQAMGDRAAQRIPSYTWTSYGRRLVKAYDKIIQMHDS